MKVHFIGVNGVSMRSLAEILAIKGNTVSGTDLRPCKINGVTTFVEDGQVNFDSSCDLVIYNTDIPQDNLEYIFAKQNLIPLVHRTRILEDFTQTRYKIAVTGSSGKTSTTLYTYELLKQLGVDPFVLVGEANFENDRCFQDGAGPFVIELNEGDMKHTEESADICLFVNFSEDHVWAFASKEEMIKHYIALFNRCGMIIYNSDDIEGKTIVEQSSTQKITFGFKHNPDSEEHFQIINFVETLNSISFEILHSKKGHNKSYKIKANLHGKFSAYNVTAAIIANYFFTNKDINEIVEKTKSLKHSKRRMDIIYESPSLTIIEDQALFYTEHKTTLDCLKKFGKPISIIADAVRSKRAELFRDTYFEVWKGHNVAVVDKEFMSDNTTFLKDEQDIFNFLNNINGICCFFVKRFWLRDAVHKWIQEKQKQKKELNDK